MYLLYLGSMLCPVTPSKIQTKIGSTNKVISLINEGQANMLKEPALTEVTFDILLPNHEYGFAVYKNGFVPAAWYINFLAELKTAKSPFRFMIVRKISDGMRRTEADSGLLNTSMDVSLEDYTVTEDTSRGGIDMIVSVRLKQYRQYGTQLFRIVGDKAVKKSGSQRQTNNSPAPKKTNETHTIVYGDTLWGIAKRYYGDGSQYTKIVEANKDKVSDPNNVPVGTVLVIPV